MISDSKQNLSDTIDRACMEIEAMLAHTRLISVNMAFDAAQVGAEAHTLAFYANELNQMADGIKQSLASIKSH